MFDGSCGAIETLRGLVDGIEVWAAVVFVPSLVIENCSTRYAATVSMGPSLGSDGDYTRCGAARGVCLTSYRILQRVSEMPLLHGGGGVDLGNRSRLTAIPTMSRRHISLDVGFATGIPPSSRV